MHVNTDSEVPIYLQVAEQIESAILSGAFPEETQVPSTTEISVAYQINPATVLKGMTQLVGVGLLYKKRGIGMFVAREAQKMVLEKRKKNFYDDYIIKLLDEAEKLRISRAELIDMISGGENHGRDNDVFDRN